MKDKFEKVIRSKIKERLGENSYEVSGIMDAAKACNTLHQQAMKEEGAKNFDRGYACAVANLISLHGDSTEAQETFRQNFSGIKDIKKLGVSEFDLEILQKYFY